MPIILIDADVYDEPVFPFREECRVQKAKRKSIVSLLVYLIVRPSSVAATARLWVGPRREFREWDSSSLQKKAILPSYMRRLAAIQNKSRTSAPINNLSVYSQSRLCPKHTHTHTGKEWRVDDDDDASVMEIG